MMAQPHTVAITMEILELKQWGFPYSMGTDGQMQALSSQTLCKCLSKIAKEISLVQEKLYAAM